MATLLIIANQPIRLDRDVAGDEVLATIDTEHNVATILMMLQQRQARLVIEGNDELDIKKPAVNQQAAGDGVQEGDNTPKTFAEQLAAAEINDKSIELLAAAGVTGVAKAHLYLAEHAGSFEPIKGIGKKTSDRIIEMLG